MDPGLTGRLAQPVDGIDNGYLAGYRVRFDEAGPDGRMRTSALLRYAQDVAWRHSEQLGFDRAWYVARGLGWVVRGCELEVREPIPIGHTLRVLRSTDRSVLLIERDRVARGATGRNAGQLTTYFERPLASIAQQFGEALAIDAQRTFDDAHDLMDAIAAEAGTTVRVERFDGH